MLRASWRGTTLGSGSDVWKYWAELRAGGISAADWEGIEERIAIIQTSNVTDVEHAVLHSIDPAAAIRPLVRRKTERVRDAPGGISVVGQFPKLFYSQTVNLRLSTFVETKTLNQLLC